jgi:hypothetical protein
MPHLILVHGRGQAFAIPETARRELAEATRWGLQRAGYDYIDWIPIDFAFYGDLYRSDADAADGGAERGGASLEHSALQAAIAGDLLGVTETAADPEAERLGVPDLVRLVATLDERFGVGARFVRRFMADVAAYLDDQDLRERTIDRVRDAVMQADLAVLVGHSLGSIAAYELLLRDPGLHVGALVTFGSPLGLPTVRRRLQQRGADRFPPNLRRWVNVYNQEDFVAAVPLLQPLYPSGDDRSIEDVEALGQDPSLRNPAAAHDIATYLSSMAMGRALTQVLDELGLGAAPEAPEAVPMVAAAVEESASEPYLEVGEAFEALAVPEDAEFERPAMILEVDEEAERGSVREGPGQVPAPDGQAGSPTDGGTAASRQQTRTVERTASADFPPVVEPESENLLQFAIAREAVYSHGTPFIIEVPADAREETITVSVQASDFDILDPDTGRTRNFHRVTLDLTDEGQEVRGAFLLRAHAADADLRTTIYLRFSHANLPVGQIDLSTTISPARAQVSAARASSVGGGIRLSLSAAPPPDLVFHVSRRDDGRFEIAVDRRSGPKPFDNWPLGSFPVVGEASGLAASILQQFRTAREMKPAALRENRIDGLGLALWWQLPDQFRTFYWEEMHGQELSIAINSQEPYIPWELVKPQRDPVGGETAPMLGLAFAIARWKQKCFYPVPLTIAGFAAIAPAYQSNPLEHTAAEAAELERRYGARLVPGRYAEVTDLLKGTGVQAIHFAGHGRFEPANPTDSKIELSDSPLVPGDVMTATVGRSDRPLVFVNACEVGNQGWALTQIGGWADTFCDAGCTAFVGPYWAVNDQVAKKAALLFYEELRTGRTVGQAMQAIRRQFWEDDEFRYHPTWLAYSLHCHPNVTVDFAERA